MKTIKARLGCLTVANALGLITILFLFFSETMTRIPYHILIFIVAFIVLFMLFAFLIREYAQYKIAKLIMENEIIYIETAKIEIKKYKRNRDIQSMDGADIYISCFGILIGHRAIKFNVDEIVLKNIEVGKGWLGFTYGSPKKVQKIRILHNNINEQELQTFMDKIRYETGIIPALADHKLIE